MRYNDYIKDGAHKSQFKGVYRQINVRDGTYSYLAHIPTKNRNATKYFETEKEAALAVDKGYINIGKEPVNILKRK